jgi:uncharacterized protein YdaU (DUF1376 family)
MAEFPALPLWTDAYLADTIHLNNRESGAYLHLLMAAWRLPNGELPNDHALLARYARCTSSEWLYVKGKVMPFFTLVNGKFIQKRLERERAFVRGRAEKARAAANAKWLKAKGSNGAHAYAGQMLNSPQAYPPTPTPIKKEATDLKEGKQDGGKFHVKIDSPQWAAWRKFYGGKAPPCDKDFGWLFPSEWPPGHVSSAP